MIAGGIATAVIIHKVNSNSNAISEITFQTEKRIYHAISKIEKDLRDNIQSIHEGKVQLIQSLEKSRNDNYQKLAEEFVDKWDESRLQFIQDNKNLVRKSLEGISTLEGQIKELETSISNDVDNLSEEAQKMLAEQQEFKELLKGYPPQLLNSISTIGDYIKAQKQQLGNIIAEKLETITERLEAIKRISQSDKQEITELLRSSVDPVIDCLKRITRDTTQSREDHESFAALINKDYNTLLNFSEYSQEKTLAIKKLFQELQDNSLKTTELNKYLENGKEGIQRIIETSLSTIQKDIYASVCGIKHIEDKISELEKNLQSISSIMANTSTPEILVEPRPGTENPSKEKEPEPESRKADTVKEGIDPIPSTGFSGSQQPFLLEKPVPIQGPSTPSEEQPLHIPSYGRDPLPNIGEIINGEKVKPDPRKRGGRRPGSKGTPNNEEAKRVFPEMYCIKRAGRWEVILKLPKQILKLTQRNLADITINKEPVRFDPRRGECLINKLETECAVTSDVYHSSHKQFGNGEYLLFKLRKKGAGDARFVEKYSDGVYLCIVPEDFSVDRSRSCVEHITPEKVSIPGHLVHFFNPSPEKGIFFHKPDGKILEIPTYFQKFSLEGNKLAFVTEEDFFINELPAIVSNVPRYWNQVDQIVLRHEIAGEYRPKEVIIPADEGERKRIILPKSMKTRGGHFSVLLYNKCTDLIESHPFYFHRDIASIETSGYAPYAEKTPSEIYMKISHTPGMVFTPLDKVTSQNVEYETKQGETSIVFPQCPEIQTFQWKIEQEDSDTVSFSFDFPGFYWSIGNCQNPGRLTKEQIELSFKDLKATAGKMLYVQAPGDADKFRAILQYSNSIRRKMNFNSETGFWEINISVLGQKIVAEKKEYANRRIPLVISFYKQDGFHQKHIGNFIEKRICKYCGEKIPADQLKQHFKENHIKEIFNENFRETSYEELKAIDKSLPEAIYKCPYCPFYSKKDGYENPNDVICKHIQEKHHGEVISFTPVSDVTEIRENVLTHLCETWRCKICAKDFTDQEEMLRHLFKKHLNSLLDDTKEV